jgi:hypothetical protein
MQVFCFHPLTERRFRRPGIAFLTASGTAKHRKGKEQGNK